MCVCVCVYNNTHYVKETKINHLCHLDLALKSMEFIVSVPCQALAILKNLVYEYAPFKLSL